MIDTKPRTTIRKHKTRRLTKDRILLQNINQHCGQRKSTLEQANQLSARVTQEINGRITGKLQKSAKCFTRSSD